MVKWDCWQSMGNTSKRIGDENIFKPKFSVSCSEHFSLLTVHLEHLSRTAVDSDHRSCHRNASTLEKEHTPYKKMSCFVWAFFILLSILSILSPTIYYTNLHHLLHHHIHQFPLVLHLQHPLSSISTPASQLTSNLCPSHLSNIHTPNEDLSDLYFLLQLSCP